MERTTVDQLIERSAALLLDAYGVLVHSGGAMPGAARLIERLEREGKPYRVLTNDASRLPETCASHYRAMGLAIPVERVLAAGELIAPWFASRGLAGARTAVFGPRDSERYVELAGGVVVDPDSAPPPAVVAICDEAVDSFLPQLDDLLSLLFASIDAGRRLELVLANPDLIYPRARGFGVGVGSVALVLERAMALRVADPPRFDRLGKPHRPIFEEAARRLGTRDLVMIGDQLETDIKGAKEFGIPAVLVTTGVSRHHPAMPIEPDFLLEGLE